MRYEKYTNGTYVPINKLTHLTQSDIKKVMDYREDYKDIIKTKNGTFPFIVETPKLIKERFIVNVSLAKKTEISAEDNDLIKKIAKELIEGEKPSIFIPQKDKNIILKQYKENNNDLTIITTFLVENIDSYIDALPTNIEQIIPELTKNDMFFIHRCYNTKLMYTVKNYQNSTHTSYETARSSLERLARLKLYEKTKSGKKFVYKPTQKLANIIKGEK